MTTVIAGLALAASAQTWNLVDRPPLSRWPSSLTGTLQSVKGFNAQFAEAIAMIKLADGRVRGIPYRSLDAQGQARVDAWMKANPRPQPRETRDHTFIPGPYDQVKDASAVNFRLTPHFAIHWGNEPGEDIKSLFATSAFIDRNARYLEEIREFFRRDGATMPGSQYTPPRKLNVYITGTGLREHREGFAFGGWDIVMHPGAMADGSTVVPHEFGHCIQLASGGFRNSELVGWFWECHANWCSQRYLPHYPAAVEVYAERAHYELTSSRMNYGSWPFLEVLATDPKLGPQFCYDIWTKNRKNDLDQSIEDPLETIVRVAKERGAFPRGWVDFGDRIGTLAARMAGLDFEQQWAMERTIRGMDERSLSIMRSRTGVDPIPGEPGWFTPWFSQAPRQFGYNLIDVTPTAGAKVVKATFRPETDIAHADWRVTLVAIDAEGRSRYSPMVSRGSISLARKAGDQRIVLAVAATPTAYKPDPFRPGYGRKSRYPYAVRFDGATPAPRTPPAPKPSFRRHPNGGGLVAITAKVAESAYVGPGAAVLDTAQVLDEARILDRAMVRGSAVVSDRAVVAGAAVVAEAARVSGEAQVSGGALVSQRAQVRDRARVRDAVYILGDGVVGDDALVKGWGEVHTSPKGALGGVAMIGEDSEIHLSSSPIPEFRSGLLYGFLAGDLFRNDVKATDGLVADIAITGRIAALDRIGDHQGVRSAVGTRFDGSLLDAAQWRAEITLNRAPGDLLRVVGREGEMRVRVDAQGVVRVGEVRLGAVPATGKVTLRFANGRLAMGTTTTAASVQVPHWVLIGKGVSRVRVWRENAK